MEQEISFGEYEALLKKYEELLEEHEELLGRRGFKQELIRGLSHDMGGALSSLGNAGELLDEYLSKIESLYHLIRATQNQEDINKLEKQLKEKIFETRRFARTIEASSARASNLMELIKLSEVSPEQIDANAKAFRPYENITQIIESSLHSLIRNGLGLKFYYDKDFPKAEFHTNKGAFNSILGNFIQNSIQYANKNSVILSNASIDNATFSFEIENMIGKPIDDKELEHLFEKGYRKEEIKPGEINEGFGLYFANIAVRTGYEGKIEAHGQGNFRITKERTQYSKMDKYGIIPPESYIPLTPFHAKITMPLERLIKKEEPKKEDDQDQDLGIMGYI